jgi:hypothetical protein
MSAGDAALLFALLFGASLVAPTVLLRGTVWQPVLLWVQLAAAMRGLAVIGQVFVVPPFQSLDSSYYAEEGTRWAQNAHLGVSAADFARKNIGMVSISRYLAELFPQHAFETATIVGGSIAIVSTVVLLRVLHSAGATLPPHPHLFVLAALASPSQLCFLTANMKESYIHLALTMVVVAVLSRQRRWHLLAWIVTWWIRPAMLPFVVLCSVFGGLLSTRLGWRCRFYFMAAPLLVTIAYWERISSTVGAEYAIRDPARSELPSPFLGGRVPLPFVFRIMFGPEPWHVPLSLLGLAVILEVIALLGLLFVAGRYLSFPSSLGGRIGFMLLSVGMINNLAAAAAGNAGLLIRLRAPGLTFLILGVGIFLGGQQASGGPPDRRNQLSAERLRIGRRRVPPSLEYHPKTQPGEYLNAPNAMPAASTMISTRASVWLLQSDGDVVHRSDVDDVALQRSIDEGHRLPTASTRRTNTAIWQSATTRNRSDT